MSKYADKIYKSDSLNITPRARWVVCPWAAPDDTAGGLYMSKYGLDMHKYAKYARNVHRYATKICTICNYIQKYGLDLQNYASTSANRPLIIPN